jgi:hypothetical protein
MIQPNGILSSKLMHHVSLASHEVIAGVPTEDLGLPFTDDVLDRLSISGAFVGADPLLAVSDLSSNMLAAEATHMALGYNGNPNLTDESQNDLTFFSEAHFSPGMSFAALTVSAAIKKSTLLGRASIDDFTRVLDSLQPQLRHFASAPTLFQSLARALLSAPGTQTYIREAEELVLKGYDLFETDVKIPGLLNDYMGSWVSSSKRPVFDTRYFVIDDNGAAGFNFDLREFHKLFRAANQSHYNEKVVRGKTTPRICPALIIGADGHKDQFERHLNSLFSGFRKVLDERLVPVISRSNNGAVVDPSTAEYMLEMFQLIHPDFNLTKELGEFCLDLMLSPKPDTKLDAPIPVLTW